MNGQNDALRARNTDRKSGEIPEQREGPTRQPNEDGSRQLNVVHP